MTARCYVCGRQILFVEVGSAASRLGLMRGDFLLRLDEVPLASWELFERALEERPSADHEVAWFRPTSGEVQRGRFTLRGADSGESVVRGARFGAAGEF